MTIGGRYLPADRRLVPRPGRSTRLGARNASYHAARASPCDRERGGQRVGATSSSTPTCRTLSPNLGENRASERRHVPCWRVRAHLRLTARGLCQPVEGSCGYGILFCRTPAHASCRRRAAIRTIRALDRPPVVQLSTVSDEGRRQSRAAARRPSRVRVTTRQRLRDSGRPYPRRAAQGTWSSTPAREVAARTPGLAAARARGRPRAGDRFWPRRALHSPPRYGSGLTTIRTQHTLPPLREDDLMLAPLRALYCIGATSIARRHSARTSTSRCTSCSRRDRYNVPRCPPLLGVWLRSVPAAARRLVGPERVATPIRAGFDRVVGLPGTETPAAPGRWCPPVLEGSTPGNARPAPHTPAVWAARVSSPTSRRAAMFSGMAASHEPRRHLAVLLSTLPRAVTDRRACPVRQESSPAADRAPLRGAQTPTCAPPRARSTRPGLQFC